MKLSRSQDFARPSKNNFELSDRQIKKYDGGHTFINQGYIWYPQNKTRKFIYDVNKEVELQNALQAADDPKLYAKTAVLESKLRDPYRSYIGNAFMNSSGYHDRAKHVAERNRLISEASSSAIAKDNSAYDDGEFGRGKMIVSRVAAPLYARSRVQDAKNSYRNLVQATASLPEEERKKVFKRFEDGTAKKFTIESVGMGAGLTLPGTVASALPAVVNTAIDYKTPGEYKDIQDSFENIL